MSRSSTTHKRLQTRMLSTTSRWSRKVPFPIRSRLWKCWSKKGLIDLCAICRSLSVSRGSITRSRQRLRCGLLGICLWTIYFKMESNWLLSSTIRGSMAKIKTQPSLTLSWLTRTTIIASKNCIENTWLKFWVSWPRTHSNITGSKPCIFYQASSHRSQRLKI